jgi:hypothetical protein
VSAVLLVTGCYTGVEGFDAGGPGAPPGAGDDAGDGDGDAGNDGDDGEPTDDEPCRTTTRTASRLLTAAEYERSVHRLLGVDTEVRTRLPADDRVSDLFAHNGAVELDWGKVRTYMLVAEDLAEVTPILELAPCEPGDTADTQLACAEALVRDLGRKAYRRPLTNEEAARWVDVYLGAREDETIAAGFGEAARTVVAGMLQSPSFLMVTEIGEVRGDTPEGLRSLTAHELAAKLALLLWDELPDEELSQLADDGGLVDPEVLEAQARRMLEDPRARPAILAFFEQWLRTDAVRSNDNVGATLQQAMVRETSLLVEHVLWSDDAQGSLGELLTADYTFANAELAEHYGLPTAGLTEELVQVSLPPERVGILGHGSLLASYGAESATIYRGLHVYRDMMCRSTMPPPDVIDTGVFGDLEPHEAAEARIENATCRGCHGGFEAVGLAFEGFDATGRARQEYEDGDPVDAGGWWPEPNAQEFEGVPELASALAASEEVKHCTAQRAAELAFGRDAQQIPGQVPTCIADPIAEAFVTSDGDLRELMVSLVLSDAFRLRDPGQETPTCE